MNKSKKIDPMTQSVYLGLLAFILFVVALVLFKMGKKPAAIGTAIAFIACAVIAGIRFIYAANTPGYIVENDYEGEGCYKCESDTECIIRPLSTLTEDTAIDGINTNRRPNQVFKVSNGTHAKITADGEVIPSSFISRWLSPGWVDADFFKAKGALEQWKPLFECQTT